MPGHFIKAKCACGFTKGLMPGLNDGELFGEYRMAYVDGGADLDTVERHEIERGKFTVLSDPFLEEMDGEYSSEMFNEVMKRRAVPQGPHDCPKCQSCSLYLYLVGHWG